ncbi:MAG: tetratricopeptide repeat protein, partial [Ktedonobacteraceae bacterium]
EAADWFTRTKMYDAVCFVSFEYGGDAAMLLSVLGHFLGINDGYYNPTEIKTALARVKAAFRKKRTLIIADNLESVLPEGEAPLPPEIRSQLWSVLLELTEMGAGVLLTSRDAALSEEKLRSGSQVAHLSLQGLRPNDAYALAGHLLDTLGIDPLRAPYAELRDLLSQLDYLPLAIQLVLPTLRDLLIATIRAELSTLLPKFVDDAETGRNRSLLASLEYSLRRLSEGQRALLPLLATFQGGASEDDLLAITEIPASAWASLRLALEQAALLTLEQVANYTASFLRFHPVLVPFLRGQAGANDLALCERYAAHYAGLANHLYDEDQRHPQAVRALVLRELPNLRRALALLLEQGQGHAAALLADRIIRFLNIFGRLRERDELRQPPMQAFPAPSSGEALTRSGYLRQSGLGEDEYSRGNLQVAFARFTALVKRIEALPEGAPLGSGSYEHCLMLTWLGRCLRAGGHPAAAETQLREAQAIIEGLLKQEPEDQTCIHQQDVILTDLGNALLAQGRYQEAREVYEQSLHIARQQGDVRKQAIILTHLGNLELAKHYYDEARTRYTEARRLFHLLREPTVEAGAWHQLGMVAQEQREWAEAERCYRASLVLSEQRGDLAGAASTCNQLAIVAERAGRVAEAEGWYKRALELDAQVRPDSLEQAQHLNNLADLLVREVRAGRTPLEQLAEARGYAEGALALKEPLDASAEIWTTLNILANIAEMERQAETAHAYRRRERETYADFAGNRYHIDRQCGRLIHNVVAATRGDAQLRAKVEEALPEFENDGWHFPAVIQRIWAGEREWHILAEELGRVEALLILRILETLDSSARPQPVGEQDKT